MTRSEMIALCRGEESSAQAGGNLDRLLKTNRMQADAPPWNYRETVIPYMREAKAYVDMGIGNGEAIANFKVIPFHANATEKDPANIDAARRRLIGLGIKVHPVASEEDMPFQDGYFQLITSYHTRFDASELYRVARKDCVFITEQIGSGDGIALNQMLETRRPPDERQWNLAAALGNLENAGFIVQEARESEPVLRFYDAGALVYYAILHPNMFPGFSVKNKADALYAVQRHIDTHSYATAKAKRFLIIAKKG